MSVNEFLYLHRMEQFEVRKDSNLRKWSKTKVLDAWKFAHDKGFHQKAAELYVELKRREGEERKVGLSFWSAEAHMDSKRVSVEDESNKHDYDDYFSENADLTTWSDHKLRAAKAFAHAWYNPGRGAELYAEIKRREEEKPIPAPYEREVEKYLYEDGEGHVGRWDTGDVLYGLVSTFGLKDDKRKKQAAEFWAEIKKRDKEFLYEDWTTWSTADLDKELCRELYRSVARDRENHHSELLDEIYAELKRRENLQQEKNNDQKE